MTMAIWILWLLEFDYITTLCYYSGPPLVEDGDKLVLLFIIDSNTYLLSKTWYDGYARTMIIS